MSAMPAPSFTMCRYRMKAMSWLIYQPILLIYQPVLILVGPLLTLLVFVVWIGLADTSGAWRSCHLRFHVELTGVNR
jgi:hypothetical protein